MAQPPETFSPQEIMDDLLDLLQEIHDHLASDPNNNRDALFDLFSDFGKGEITDVEHVLALVEPLLQDDPHLVTRFYDLVDPVRQGLQLLKRAEKALGPADYDRFVAKLYSVDKEQSLDAHEVYQEFKELLGGKHDDLLRGLAGFLPQKYGPPPPRARAKAEREQHRRRPERKHPSYAGADAPESSRPSRVKKPRVVDVGIGPAPALACFADTGAAGSSMARRPRMYEYEHDGLLPERKPASCAVSVVDDGKSSRPSRARRTRMYEYENEYDGWLPERKPASCSVSVADDSKSSRASRAKKPRADDSMSRHALVGGAVGGSARVAAAPAPVPDDANAREVKRFREAWEFETGYSLLDATLNRAMQAKGERERLNGAPASLDELFPRPEIRGYLAKMYHNKWNHMRNLLEHGGDHTAFALEAIVNRLTEKDAEAVDEARRRQDPARAAQRLQELAQERVRLEHERVRETNKANEQRRQP